MKLVAASHCHAAGALLRQAVADPDPVVFVENKLLYPLPLLAQVERDGSVRLLGRQGSISLEARPSEG